MLSCGELKNLASMEKLRYLTGSSGLNRVIRWFLVPETEELAAWVHGGELLIISGTLSQRPGFSLSSVLKQAMQLKMAGVLLLVGENYIKKISTEIMNQAVKNDFAIMAIPWDVPLVDIQESLGRAIVTKDNHLTRDNALDFLLAGKIPAREYASLTLGPLEKKREKYENLLETMEAFFATNGNIIKSAERLFIHRNTMKYRLDQVEKLLDCSLENAEVRLRLQLAVYILRHNE